MGRRKIQPGIGHGTTTRRAALYADRHGSGRHLCGGAERIGVAEHSAKRKHGTSATSARQPTRVVFESREELHMPILTIFAVKLVLNASP